jgi:hypothetical protein
MGARQIPRSGPTRFRAALQSSNGEWVNRVDPFRIVEQCPLPAPSYRARSLPKVVVDNRAKELSVVGFLCLRQAYLHLVALKGKQPRELLRTRQEMLGERFQAFVCEELDNLGNS